MPSLPTRGQVTSMGGAEKNRESERHGSLESWRQAGEELRGEVGLHRDADRRVREVFLKAIVGDYWTKLYDFLTKEMGVSVSELASEIGVNRGTPYRWLVRDVDDSARSKGSGPADPSTQNRQADSLEKPSYRGPREPSLRNFLLTLTAFDIDPAEDAVLPRGSNVALRAYCQAFDALERVELGNDAATAIQPEEVLCLHFAIRCLRWREAVDQFDRDELKHAAGNIFEQVRCYIDKPRITTVDDLAAVLRQRIRTWVILETILTYEWF